MSGLWIIIAALPVMLITALFLGFEPAFYYGINLIGASFWILTENRRMKFFGILVCIIGLIFFIAALSYYFMTETFFPKNPFELKIPSAIYKFIAKP